jgi:hypothetical protein
MDATAFAALIGKAYEDWSTADRDAFAAQLTLIDVEANFRARTVARESAQRVRLAPDIVQFLDATMRPPVRRRQSISNERVRRGARRAKYF